MILRDFLYLDRDLVQDFLAQAEGGLIDEATERRSQSGRGGFGGKLGAGPLEVSGEKGKEHSVETETVVHQSPASEFDRLYTLLEGDDLVVLDEVSNDEVIGQIQRKQMLEVDGRVQVAGLHQLLKLMGTIGTLAPLMGELRGASDVDQETLDAIKAMTALSGGESRLPVIATVPGTSGLRIALELNPAFVQTEDWDVDASVLLKVQRLLKIDETYTVGDPFGGLMKLMPDSDQTNILDSMDADELAKLGIGEASIEAPGILATPIAIYR
ncbi:MAG: hypothetical protein JO214_16015 [Frankiaceae bacterium]|nr:hypothetical protein [Frankiaceae bacterium]